MTEYFSPDASLFEASKFGKLEARKEQKQERLLSTSTEPDNFIPESTSRVSNLLDLFQSSSLQEAGLASDAVKNVSNYVSGTEGDGSRADGYSNIGTADEAAGVDPQVRAALQQGQHKVYEDIARGEYGTALLDALKIAPETAADSGGSLIGGIVGTAATGGLGAIPKVKRVGETLLGIFDEYKKVKKAVELGGKVAKSVAQASVISTTQSQRIVHDYQEAHNGEMPSPARVASIVVGSIATQTADLVLFKKLFLPKGKKAVQDAKDLVRTMTTDKTTINSIANRISSGLLKVGAAGSAESVQEYIQTWQEILSVKAEADGDTSFLDSVFEQVRNPDNQTEALTGATLGGTAGGFTKSLGTVPTEGLGIAADAAIGTTKGIYNTTKKAVVGVANKSAKNKLSEEDKQNLHTEYQAQAEIVKQKTEDLKTQATIIEKASTLDELMDDETIAPVVKQHQEALKLTEEDLQNPENVKTLKAALKATYEKDQKTLKKSLEGSNLSHFKSTSGKPRETNTSAPTTTQVEELTTQFTPHGEEAVTAINELETGLAADTVAKATKNAEGVSSIAIKQAKQLSVHDLERVAAIVQNVNPEAAKVLRGLAKGKTNALRRFTPSKEKIIDDSNIDETLKSVSESGELNEKHIPYISAALSSAMHKKISSAGAIKTLQNVIKSYRKSEAFRQQGKGVVHPATLTKWEKRLDLMAKKQQEKPAEETTEKPKEETVEKTESTKEETKEEPEKEDSKEPKKPKEKTSTETESTVTEEPTVEEPKKSTKMNVVLKSVSESIATFVRSGADLTPIINQIPKLAERLVKEGYTTKEDFEALIEEFPGFKASPEVLNLLALKLYNPNVKESFIHLKPPTEAEIDALYTKLFPGCKI